MAGNKARKVEGGADAPTQEQTASAEPVQQQTPGQALEGAGPDERQYFEGSVLKIDAEGHEVMSDHLAPGERLRRATTGEYAADKREERRDSDSGK